jgi:hypothetical protein
VIECPLCHWLLRPTHLTIPEADGEPVVSGIVVCRIERDATVVLPGGPLLTPHRRAPPLLSV